MKSAFHAKINSCAFISVKHVIALFVGISSSLLLVAIALNVVDLPLGNYLHANGLVSFSVTMLVGAVMLGVAIWFVSKLFKAEHISVFCLLSIPTYFVVLSLPREASTLLIALITGFFTWAGFLFLDNKSMLEYRDIEDETI